MSIDGLIEGVKFFGGIGGLASSALLIYDRVFRSRPSVYLRPTEYRAQLCVRNVVQETIIIDEILVSPPLIGVMTANDLKSIVQTVAESFYPDMTKDGVRRTYTIIEPVEMRSFGLVLLEAFKNANEDTNITITCRWRNTRKPFPLKRTVCVKTTVRDIQSLNDVAVAKKS